MKNKQSRTLIHFAILEKYFYFSAHHSNTWKPTLNISKSWIYSLVNILHIKSTKLNQIVHCIYMKNEPRQFWNPHNYSLHYANYQIWPMINEWKLYLNSVVIAKTCNYKVSQAKNWSRDIPTHLHDCRLTPVNMKVTKSPLIHYNQSENNPSSAQRTVTLLKTVILMKRKWEKVNGE